NCLFHVHHASCAARSGVAAFWAERFYRCRQSAQNRRLFGSLQRPFQKLSELHGSSRQVSSAICSKHVEYRRCFLESRLPHGRRNEITDRTVLSIASIWLCAA